VPSLFERLARLIVRRPPAAVLSCEAFRSTPLPVLIVAPVASVMQTVSRSSGEMLRTVSTLAAVGASASRKE